MNRVLIIKTGETECFAESDIPGISLGEVLRSSVILHLFKGFEIVWITSTKAFSLLAENPHLQVIPEEDFDEASMGSFDVIVNLEKSPRWTEFLHRQRSGRLFGFTDKRGRYMSGNLETHPTLNLSRIGTWQQGLFTLLGKTWRGERYVYINPKLESIPPIFDVGLNWQCGPKWPSKKWSEQKWSELHDKLSSEFKVSWQKGFDCLEEYAAWIQSCRSLITVDSLGLHMALALGKKVVAIFGPTSPEQVYLYESGQILSPSNEEFPCAPCFDSLCSREISCMNRLSVNNAETAFKHLYSGGPSS